jgi:hypothetical protein
MFPYGEMKSLNVVRVVLKLPVTVGPLLERANSLLQQLQDNATLFPAPDPSLVELKAGIDALTLAQANLKASLGHMSAREDARKALVVLLHRAQAYVQSRASAEPKNAASIAAAASLALRKPPVRHKADLELRPVQQGMMRAVGKAIPGARTYEWQYSLDGSTWLGLPSTTRASTFIANLTPGSTVHVRRRWVTKNGTSEWSDAVSAIVT